MTDRENVTVIKEKVVYYLALTYFPFTLDRSKVQGQCRIRFDYEFLVNGWATDI